ncbi:MAG: dihydrodipicolinate synthase family protein [Gemmatimonadota bacterium]|nr:MAG: dihydrodipicolinate synthase family protein [Gemmatimonadota bacterium]
MLSSELKEKLINVHTYAITPFKADDLLQLDLDAFARNLTFLVERGIKVVAVGGGTGEFEALTNDELEALARTALETVGERALVIATLPPNLKAAAELAPRYAELGVPVMLGMPPLIRGRVPSDLEGTFEYFRLLARVTEVPLMPYNTQGWPAEFYQRLADIERIIGIKDPMHHPHTLFQAIQLLGDRFVWIGNKRHDPGVVHLRYQMGMEAFTSGQSNFWPEPELAIHAAAQARDWPRVIELQQQCAPLERLRMESDDAAMVKGAMDLLGLNGGRVRPPRRNMSDEARAALSSTLGSLGLM